MFSFSMPCLSSYTFFEDGRVWGKSHKKFIKQAGGRVAEPSYQLKEDNSRSKLLVTIREIIAYGKHKKQEIANTKALFLKEPTQTIIYRQVRKKRA